MKKIISLFVTFIMFISASSLVSADDINITVKINEQTVSFDTNPLIINDRVFVPIRNVCEELGADVYWDGTRELVYVVKNDIKLCLKINSTRLIKVRCKNAEEFTNMPTDNIVEMDVCPIIVNGRTLLPIRAVCEALGADVEWSNTDSTVNILCNNNVLEDVNTDKDFFYEMLSYLDTKYKKVAGNVIFADGDNNIILTKEHILWVSVNNDEIGYYVELILTSEGQRKFAEATDRISKQSENNYISVVLNGSIISAPRVSDKIDSERVVIRGIFTIEEAITLADEISGL